tara:strand:+ start:290 stop:490 length:201 start_codon:yes stop_codon:yes gene_type:complete
MFRIKCSNGKYVSKTSGGSFISYTKGGKVWHSKNLVYKNLDWCEEFAESEFAIERYGKLTYNIEES